MNQDIGYKHKSTKDVIYQILNATLGSFYFGYSLGVLNLAYPTVERVLDIQEGKEFYRGLINALVPIGAAIGAIGSGILLDNYSRRISMMITDLIGIISCLLQAIPMIPTTILARLLAGVVTGLNSAIVPLYIKETSPIEITGLTGSMNQTLINFGTLFSYILGLGFSRVQEDTQVSGYWRIVLMFPIVTCMLRIYLLQNVYIYQTPLYYVLNDQETSAQQALMTIYEDQYIKDKLKELKLESQTKSQVQLNFNDLFAPKYNKRTWMAIILMVFQQFSGSNAVVIYSQEIFLGLTTESMAIFLAILVGFIQTISAIFSGAVSQVAGRQLILLFGEGVMVFSLLLLWVFTIKQNNAGSGYEIDLVLLIFLYNVAFNASLGPVIWLYIAEILPEQGVSIGALTNWSSVVVIAYFFPFLNQSIGIANIFLIFGLFCAAGFIYVKLQMKETQDLQPHEIEELFQEKQGSQTQEPLLKSTELIQFSKQTNQ